MVSIFAGQTDWLVRYKLAVVRSVPEQNDAKGQAISGFGADSRKDSSSKSLKTGASILAHEQLHFNYMHTTQPNEIPKADPLSLINPPTTASTNQHRHRGSLSLPPQIGPAVNPHAIAWDRLSIQAPFCRLLGWSASNRWIWESVDHRCRVLAYQPTQNSAKICKNAWGTENCHGSFFCRGFCRQHGRRCDDTRK